MCELHGGNPVSDWDMTLEDLEPQIPKCLDFLRDNAPMLGKLKGRCKALQERKKVILGIEFMEAGHQYTVAERNALAQASVAYQGICEDIEGAEAEYETLRVLMNLRELKVEVWRSLNSRAGRGHV